MKKPIGLNESEARLWNVFDSFQRIDASTYFRFGRAQDRLVVRGRFRFRLALLRRVKTRMEEQNEINQPCGT